MQLKRLRKSLKVQQKKLNISSENNSDAGMLNKYALVLVNIRGLGVKTFSYLIPDEMKEKIKIGQAVLVPFGRQGLINAFVVGFSDYLGPDGRHALRAGGARLRADLQGIRR